MWNRGYEKDRDGAGTALLQADGEWAGNEAEFPAVPRGAQPPRRGRQGGEEGGRDPQVGMAGDVLPPAGVGLGLLRDSFPARVRDRAPACGPCPRVPGVGYRCRGAPAPGR